MNWTMSGVSSAASANKNILNIPSKNTDHPVNNHRDRKCRKAGNHRYGRHTPGKMDGQNNQPSAT